MKEIIKGRFETLNVGKVAKDLCDIVGWKLRKFDKKSIDPCVEAVDADGTPRQFDIRYCDDIIQNYGNEMQTFDDECGYVYSFWGQNEKGQWKLAIVY